MYAADGTILHNHPTSFETSPGVVSVGGDVDRIRFYSDHTDGFNGIISVNKNGVPLSFSCANCVDGSNTNLNRLYLDGDMTRTPEDDIAACDGECDFYPTGPC